MKNNSFTKNDLLFYYQKYAFPSTIIINDVLIHKEFIFADSSQEPENSTYTKKKIKFTNSYIIEEEIEPKTSGFKKGKNPNFKKQENSITKGYAFNNTNANYANNWRKNEFEDPGFFDNFKGKSDERQVMYFKRNLELAAVQENNFSIDNAIFTDHMEKDTFKLKKIDLNADNNSSLNNTQQNNSSRYIPANVKLNKNFETGNNYNFKEISATADDLFNNTEGIFSNINLDNKKNQAIKNNAGRKNSFQNLAATDNNRNSKQT